MLAKMESEEMELTAEEIRKRDAEQKEAQDELQAKRAEEMEKTKKRQLQMEEVKRRLAQTEGASEDL